MSQRALEEGLRARVDAGRAAWPTLELNDESFVRHLATHLRKGQLPPLARAPDLWLACACACGVPGAVDAFHRAYRSSIERKIAHIHRSNAPDVTQQVLAALLVPQGDKRPRIEQYGGRASLHSWLTTVAAHAALDSRRGQEGARNEVASGLADAIAQGEADLQVIRERYGAVLEPALRRALGALDTRQRLLLRLHHLDGLSIDRLGEIYKVDRSTAARWLATAREELLAQTRADLCERLRITATEADSLLRTLHRDLLAMSIARLLKEAEGA
jgi:RNA polymerase sigma-70 factor (ECF subfamily)